MKQFLEGKSCTEKSKIIAITIARAVGMGGYLVLFFYVIHTIVADMTWFTEEMVDESILNKAAEDGGGAVYTVTVDGPHKELFYGNGAKGWAAIGTSFGFFVLIPVLECVGMLFPQRYRKYNPFGMFAMFEETHQSENIRGRMKALERHCTDLKDAKMDKLAEPIRKELKQWDFNQLKWSLLGYIGLFAIVFTTAYLQENLPCLNGHNMFDVLSWSSFGLIAVISVFCFYKTLLRPFHDYESQVTELERKQKENEDKMKDIKREQNALNGAVEPSSPLRGVIRHAKDYLKLSSPVTHTTDMEENNGMEQSETNVEAPVIVQESGPQVSQDKSIKQDLSFDDDEKKESEVGVTGHSYDAKNANGSSAKSGKSSKDDIVEHARSTSRNNETRRDSDSQRGSAKFDDRIKRLSAAAHLKLIASPIDRKPTDGLVKSTSRSPGKTYRDQNGVKRRIFYPTEKADALAKRNEGDDSRSSCSRSLTDTNSCIEEELHRKQVTTMVANEAENSSENCESPFGRIEVQGNDIRRRLARLHPELLRQL